MQSLFYQKYIRSPEWEQKKAARMKLDDYKCQCCGSTENLQCHHFGYRNIGNENIYVDLVTLCSKCHEAMHRVMNRRTGQRMDGSYKRGWATVLPYGVRKSLIERGLM